MGNKLSTDDSIRFDYEWWEQIRILALEAEKEYWKIKFILYKRFGNK